jgi:hypothetical protein
MELFLEESIMKKFCQVALAFALLAGSILPASAQAFYANPWRGFGWNHFHRTFPRVFDNRLVRINDRIANLRADISERVSAGDISPGHAAMLNSRLNAIAATRDQFAATGGISVNEMARLEARLENVRVAVNGGFRYY